MEFNKKVLSNGLTVLHEKRDVPVTTVMLATKFGSAYEEESEKGIAHFIEHLCFKGTEKRTTKEIAESLENVGGILNAFTSEEETAYHVKLPSNYLELAMDVIFDIFFNPVFPEAEIEKEANVICEEIKMYNDDPRAHVMDQIKSQLYKGAFGMFIGGTEKIVRGMKREDLLKKHEEFYFPSNAVLAVVGNNDFEDVVKFAENFCPEGKEKQISKKPVIEKKNSKEEENRKNILQANLAVGLHFPNMVEGKRYAAELFSTILGSGMSSRLFSEVREKRGLAYSIKSMLDAGKHYSYLAILAGTDKTKVQDVIDISLEEIKKMENLDEGDFEEGKKQLKGSFDVSTEDCANTALNLIFEEIVGDAKKYYEYKEKIDAVSIEDVRSLAKFEDFSSFVVQPE
jgi:predicted Zn-dependent peptidase